jgi:hypothetical protein
MNGKLSSTAAHQTVLWHPQVFGRGVFPDTALRGRIAPSDKPVVLRLAPMLPRLQASSTDFWETASYVTLGLCALGGIGLCIF